jgi:sortase A
MAKSPGFWLQGALFVIAAFLLGQWAETQMDSRAFQSRATTLLETWLGSSCASLVDPGAARSRRARAEARRTGVVGRLAIPRLGIAAMVGEGVDERTLDRAIGHLPGTSFPGEQGNVGLAGHRDTFLRKLGRIERGDRIELQTADGSFDYIVVKTGVFPPSAVHLLDDTGDPLLTIVTCYPFRVIGPAPNRFVVRAVPESAHPARSPRT